MQDIFELSLTSWKLQDLVSKTWDPHRYTWLSQLYLWDQHLLSCIFPWNL